MKTPACSSAGPLPRRPSAAGFTLIELMVGIVLGLLTILFVTTVLMASESRSRVISQGSDAQSNAALALYTLQREIQMAGYAGIAAPDAIGCPVKTAAGGDPFTLAPVVITPAAGPNGSDRLTLLTGRSPESSTPIALTAGADPSNPLKTDTALGVKAGDLMILVPGSGAWAGGGWCALLAVTGTPDTNTIAHDSAGLWNDNAAGVFPSAAGSAYLLDMGALFSLRTYQISSAFNLQTVDGPIPPGDDPAAHTHDLYPQIVNLKALYVKTDPTSGAATYDQNTPATNAGWLTVQAIRIAVVARSGQYEKDAVTAADPVWDLGASSVSATGANPCSGDSGGTCITLTVSDLPASAGNTDLWKHYRYKVYDTTVPLRNMLWNLAS